MLVVYFVLREVNIAWDISYGSNSRCLQCLLWLGWGLWHIKHCWLFNAKSCLYIIIMSCHGHGYPLPSLATSPYRSSPLVGLQGHIPYPHIAAECMFELVVLLLPGHMWGSIGVHPLWARPSFSSCDLHVSFV